MSGATLKHLWEAYKMQALSNNSFHMAKRQRLVRKHTCTRFLVLVGRGTVVLAMLVMGMVFLPGCGSDSTPGVSGKGKDAIPTARAGGLKAQPQGTLLIGQAGKVEKQPDVKNIEVLPQISTEEMEAKIAANRAQFDPATMEAYPGAGITKEQFKAKVEANVAQFDPRQMEPYPGATITHEQLKAKIESNRAQFNPAMMKAYPGTGITREQFKAKVEANLAQFDRKRMEPYPGSKANRN